MSVTNNTPVRRRQVIYIPGYDPFHPRRYREIYRKESALQAEISGYELTLKPRHGKNPHGWSAEASMGGHAVQAEIEVLVWSDIVKDSMNPSILATYHQMLCTAWIYLSSGTMFRLMQLRKGPIIAALYPVLFLLGQLLIACLVAYGVGRALMLLHPFAGMFALLLIPPILMWFRKVDNKVFAYYLMHDYAYSAQLRGANPPALETRMAEFGDRIAQALKEDVDEVLVVGHSSGAYLGVSILADLIRSGRVPKNGPDLAFLSLGQVIPMVSFLPNAQRLRSDLAFLSCTEALVWIDVTAPGDGCAFALCDPVAVTGVAGPDKRWPLVLSAAFSQTMSKEAWAAKRWKFADLHFQYLYAFDRPGIYDYFQITAGPVRLADRFKGCAPSKSRIDRAISGYRSVTE